MDKQEELVFQSGTDYKLDEEQSKAVKDVLDSWAARMKTLTDKYVSEATAEAKKVAAKAAGVEVKEISPVTFPYLFPPYPYWNILVAGPYQPFAGIGAQKNFMPGQFAFVAGALWLNPAPINWVPPGPSAAQMMGAFNMQINFPSLNLSTGVAGPAIPPVNMSPIGAWTGPGFFKPFFRLLGPGIFPMPAQGVPHLYEMNVTADVSGPVPQPSFAGYSTWVFNPDIEPAIWPPYIPGVSKPPVFPHWQYEIPMRFLVYQP